MSETVGEQLQNARQARSISLEQAANATHIRLHYLRALEEGNFDALPSPAQARGFLRAYAGYLGLDAAVLLGGLGEENPPFSLAGPTLPNRSPAQAEVPSEEAELIFAEVGERLRQHRAILGLSLDDIERQTHLRSHYLQALEDGNLAGLPSPVQGRGMLNNYAAFLGLDPEPLLLRFAEGLQKRLEAQRAARPVEKPTRPAPRKGKVPPLKRLLSADFLVGGVVVLFLGGFVLWGSLRVSAMRSEAAGGTPTPTAPSIADILLDPETATGAATGAAPEFTSTATLPASFDTQAAPSLPEETNVAGGTIAATTTVTVTLPASGGAPIEIYLVVRQRAWLRVLVDGEVAFEGRVAPGRAYTFQGDERVEFITGNGAALQVFYNQNDLGILGTMGEILQRVFTLEGVMTPTATLTFTPAPTQEATPTPAITPTPGPSATSTNQP
jgi:cytoskeletal protein RodZ